MSKYREIYLENMTNAVCQIMKKNEITQQDIQFILLFRSELKKYEHTPLFTKILKGAKGLKKFISEFEDTENQKQTFETEDIDNGL